MDRQPEQKSSFTGGAARPSLEKAPCSSDPRSARRAVARRTRAGSAHDGGDVRRPLKQRSLGGQRSSLVDAVPFDGWSLVAASPGAASPVSSQGARAGPSRRRRGVVLRKVPLFFLSARAACRGGLRGRCRAGGRRPRRGSGASFPGSDAAISGGPRRRRRCGRRRCCLRRLPGSSEPSVESFRGPSGPVCSDRTCDRRRRLRRVVDCRG